MPYYLKPISIYSGNIGCCTGQYLSNNGDFESFLSQLNEKEWIVYCKPPFKNASYVVEYLGRYTHRVAISNNRIINIKDGNIIFKWRDYKDKNKWKLMMVPADEFIRRFLIHILPPGFMKIKHYGLLANRNKTKKLTLCKQLTNTTIIPTGKHLPLSYYKRSQAEIYQSALTADRTSKGLCALENHLPQ